MPQAEDEMELDVFHCVLCYMYCTWTAQADLTADEWNEKYIM
jgi:hypothetical protein